MTDPALDPPVVIREDLEGLNQRAVLRTIEVVRRLTTVLFIIAALLFASWLWALLRNQGVIDSADEQFTPFGVSGDDLSLQTRVDIFAATLAQLAFAAAVAGIALGIHLYCEVATLNAGGSLTGWNVGDPIEPDPEAEPIDLPRP
jgi:hypothetical protein